MVAKQNARDIAFSRRGPSAVHRNLLEHLVFYKYLAPTFFELWSELRIKRIREKRALRE